MATSAQQDCCGLPAHECLAADDMSGDPVSWQTTTPSWEEAVDPVFWQTITPPVDPVSWQTNTPPGETPWGEAVDPVFWQTDTLSLERVAARVAGLEDENRKLRATICETIQECRALQQFILERH